MFMLKLFHWCGRANPFKERGNIPKINNSINVEQIRTAADVYVRNKLNAGLHPEYLLRFLRNALHIKLAHGFPQQELFYTAAVFVIEKMASEGKFDKMTTFSSLKGENEKEQFRLMMAKRFSADTREMAAELRTLANALDGNLEFQRLTGGMTRTEEAEDRILARLAELRYRGDKVNRLLDEPPRLPTPTQQRPVSRNALSRTSRSINLSGMHNGQFDPRAYGRGGATERLPLGRHYSENDIPQELVHPRSTQPTRSRTPQPIRPRTIQPVRSMTPQPASTSNYLPHGSDIRHHSQSPYARPLAHTTIVARGSQDRRRSRPPPPQRLYEVPDPPQTYSLNSPPELDPNPYYRAQAASPSEQINRRDRVPRIAEQRRGRRDEANAWLSRHETIYQNDSNIIDREYDPEKDEDAESIGSLDHVQSIATLGISIPQNRVEWNGTFSG